MQTNTLLARQGSEIVALLARVGTGAPTRDEEGRLRHGGTELDKKLLAQFNATAARAQVSAYLDATADGDDQQFALSLITKHLEQVRDGVILDSKDRLLNLMGGGGCGKTQVIAQAVKMALQMQLGEVVVVAPTNRAVRVLAKRIRAVAGDSPHLRIGTCHSVFKRLGLNMIGEAMMRHLIEANPGRIYAEDADPATLAEVSDVYERFLGNEKAVKKALAIAAKLRDMPDPAVGHIGILKHIGFDALDQRVTCWQDMISSAAVVFIDEISMVPSSIVQAALDTGSHVIACGDSAQLEPVSLTFTDRSGTIRSEKPAIHLAQPSTSVFLWQSRRTNHDSPIRELADFALRAPSFAAFFAEAKRMADDNGIAEIKAFASIKQVPREDFEAGPALTYTNVTRHNWNNTIRTEIFGRPADRIVPGDKFFLSSVNPHDRGGYGVVKDEFLTLSDILTAAGEHIWPEYTFTDEAGGQITTSDVSLYEPYFKRPEEIQYLREVTASPGVEFIDNIYYTNPSSLIVAFANALTIHKSQGSEWDAVTFDLRGLQRVRSLFEEDDQTPGLGGVRWKRWRRLAYTSVSRARGRLNLIL